MFCKICWCWFLLYITSLGCHSVPENISYNQMSWNGLSWKLTIVGKTHVNFFQGYLLKLFLPKNSVQHFKNAINFIKRLSWNITSSWQCSRTEVVTWSSTETSWLSSSSSLTLAFPKLCVWIGPMGMSWSQMHCHVYILLIAYCILLMYTESHRSHFVCAVIWNTCQLTSGPKEGRLGSSLGRPA